MHFSVSSNSLYLVIYKEHVNMCNQFHHRTQFVAIMTVSGYWKSLSLVTVVNFLLTDVGKFHRLISILDGLSW